MRGIYKKRQSRAIKEKEKREADAIVGWLEKKNCSRACYMKN